MKPHYIVDIDCNRDPVLDASWSRGRDYRIRCVNRDNPHDVGWYRDLARFWRTFDSYIERGNGVIIIGPSQ